MGENSFDCDRSVVVDGDPCEPKDEGFGACSMDAQTRLQCKGGKFVETYRCRGPKKCAVDDDDDVTCDTSIGAPGDPCYAEGTGMCSEDKKGLLLCKNGKLVVESSCPTSCGTKDGEIICR
ncbi:MAG: hypothetical protein HOV80_35700 [Polyangiaceae bacterium]|nr:hypothetical protein [Polyangiaceae bacterium]